MQIKKKERGSMKKRKADKIPNFKSYKEEAEFWDTHSLADYWDKWKDVDIVFDLDKPRDETLVVRLQKDLKEKLEKIARSRGLNLSTLARMWLIEKLHSSV